MKTINLTAKILDNDLEPVRKNQTSSYVYHLTRALQLSKSTDEVKALSQIISDNQEHEKKEDKTLKDFLLEIAAAPVNREGKNDMEDYWLYIKIRKAKQGLKLETDEMKRIHEKLSKVGYGPVIRGQLEELLDEGKNSMEELEE